MATPPYELFYSQSLMGRDFDRQVTELQIPCTVMNRYTVLGRPMTNILEQSHWFIKRITKPMTGFRALHPASATLAGIWTAHMIRKGQIADENRSPVRIFADLAA